MKLSFLARTILVSATALSLGLLIGIISENSENIYDLACEDGFASKTPDFAADFAAQKKVLYKTPNNSVTPKTLILYLEKQEKSPPESLNMDLLVQTSV